MLPRMNISARINALTSGAATLERPRLRRPRAGARPAALRISRPRPELAALLLLAAVLNLWALGRNGWANEYYSAAVRSMSTSWHAFFYGSFDSSGVMTVDKPPLALWVQALSARVFGFNSLSILVPQALMGVASVALVYDLTRRRFGRAAGFVAGLVLATTPIAVAISRHNNPDALLVLCSVAALWFVVRALEDGRTRWLVLVGVCIGLGFETKMGAALLVVPGLAAAWLWVAPKGRLAALRQLLAGGAAMVVVGGAWPLLMWLTPSADRPWISGTSDNSIWSLIFGYNGLGRIDGQTGGPGGMAGGGGAPGGGGAGGGPGGNLFGGPTGPLRLLENSLGGQAGWLLGFAVMGGLALLVATRLRRTDLRSGWLIATGGAFLTCAVAFSAAKGIFHPYYVSLLAPFTAALCGATAGQLLERGNAARIVGPLAVIGGVVTELIVLHNEQTSLGWLPPVLIVLGALAAAALAVRGTARLRHAALVGALGLLLLAPATWAAETLGHATNGTFPAGGPATTGGGFGGRAGGPPGFLRSQRGSSAGTGAIGGAPGTSQGGFAPQAGSGAQAAPPGGFARQGGFGPPSSSSGGSATRGGFGGGGGGPFGANTSLTPALRYAKLHGGGTVAVSSQTGASGQIIGSNAKVVGLGGFSGRESQVSVKWLVQAVRSGKVRFVLTTGDGSPGGGRLPGDTRVGSSELMAAVKKAGHKTSVSGLYDLRGRADALAALAG
jgi:4-amino-4-deoxy-L-arabinose transferase-like glycosyltransferase